MSVFKITALIVTSFFIRQFSFAQAPVKKEKIEVNGNCGMCKRKIESGATAAGASSANWNVTTKKLDVSYDPSTTDLVKIQEAIALAGYDTRDFRASDSAYKSLEECCQYERKQLVNNKK
ncbi:MAG: cation transporter [Ginsengibacter sp.]